MTSPTDDEDVPVAESRLEASLPGRSPVFHPDSLLFEPGLTRAEIIDLNAGRRLSDALAQSSEKERVGRIFESVPDNAKEFTAIRAHEQDHYLRHLGTTYGLYCQWIRATAASVFPPLFDIAVQSRAKSAVLPLLNRSMRRASPEDLLAREPDFATYAVQFWGTRLIGEKLLGRRILKPIDQEWMIALQRHGTGLKNLPLVEGNDRVLPPPGIIVDGKQCLLGALHILEFLALGQHGNRLLSLGMELVDVASLLLTSRSDYKLLHLIWNDKFPIADWPDPFDQAVGEDESFIRYYRLYPMEMLAIADLALWMPYRHFGQSIAGDRPWRWNDIHPGWRFLRAMDFLKRKQHVLSVIPPSKNEKNELLLEIQQEVCDEFGWPTPKMLASHWVDELNSLSNDERRVVFPADESNIRFDATLQTLKLRSEFPGQVVLNDLSFPSHGLSGTPGWIIWNKEHGEEIDIVGMHGAADLPVREAGVFWPLLWYLYGGEGLQRLKATEISVVKAGYTRLLRHYLDFGGEAGQQLADSMAYLLAG